VVVCPICKASAAASRKFAKREVAEPMGNAFDGHLSIPLTQTIYDDWRRQLLADPSV